MVIYPLSTCPNHRVELLLAREISNEYSQNGISPNPFSNYLASCDFNYSRKYIPDPYDISWLGNRIDYSKG